MVASLGAALSEANIVIAQGAIADAAQEDDRPRLFGYIYMSASLAYVVGPLSSRVTRYRRRRRSSVTTPARFVNAAGS